MAIFTDDKNQKLADLERILYGKANTLGSDGTTFEEPWRRYPQAIVTELWKQTPDASNGLVAPEYDAYGVDGSVASRREVYRLHSYLPSGTSNLNVQTFVAVSSPVSSNDSTEIDAVRMKNLVPPTFSPNKSNAAEEDPNVRGFELALYPAKTGGGLDRPVEVDLDKGPIPITADPTAAYGAGDAYGWYVDYANGIVRLTAPMLHGSTGLFNPNNIYADNEGLEDTDAYGTPVLFATFYQYTGAFGISDANNFVVVGDGYNSNGDYEGKSHNVFQSALNALPSNGGTVFVKEGEYDQFYDTVTLSANQRIVGLGGSKITINGSNPAFNIAGSGSSIEGLEIRTTDASTGGSCISLGGSTGGQIISNIKVKNNTLYCKQDAYGVEFSPVAVDVVYRDVEIRNNIFRNEFDTDRLILRSSGSAGEIFVSVDGTNWTTVNAGSISVNSMAYDPFNGLWVAVGASGAISTSYNGTTWTSQTAAGSYAGTFTRVAFGGNKWVAVGTSGEIQTSTNGFVWESQTAGGGFSGTLQGVAYDRVLGVWVIVGASGEIQRSTDSISWESVTAAGGYSGTFIGIGHNDKDLWVAAGSSGEIQYSEDGSTWYQSTAFGGYSSNFQAAAHNGKDLWVIGGLGEIQTSPDGKNWTSRVTGLGAGVSLSPIIYDNMNNVWIVGATGLGGTYQSSDGLIWTSISDSDNTSGLSAVSPLPVYIGEMYNDGYSSIERLSIVENTFEPVQNSSGRVYLSSHLQGFDRINVSQNQGEFDLDITGLDGYMTEVIITENSLRSVKVGDVGRSIFNENIVNGSVVLGGTTEVKITDNNIRGMLDPSLGHAVVTGNYVRGDFDGYSVNDSTISNNIFGGKFRVGRYINGTSPTTALLDSNISDNTILGACIFGGEERDDETLTYISSSFSNNKLKSTLRVYGRMDTCSLSGNNIGGSVTLDSLADCNINDGYFGDAVTIGYAQTSGTVVSQSTFSDNVISGALDIGPSITGDTVLRNCKVSGNILGGTVTIGSGLTSTSTGLVLDGTTFSDNTVSDANMSFGNASRDEDTQTYLDSIISGNTIKESGGTLSAYGRLDSCRFSANSCDGNMTTGALNKSVFSDNYCGSDFIIADSGSSVACNESVISNNTSDTASTADLEIGNSRTAGNICVDSVVSNNVVKRILIGTSFTSTTSGYVLQNSAVTGNLADTISSAASGRDQITLTNEDSVIADNTSQFITISGKSLSCNISDNIVDTNLSIDTLDESVVSNNHIGSLLVIGGGVDVEANVMEDSMVLNNIILGGVTIGTNSAAVAVAMLNSFFEGNRCGSTVTMGHPSRSTTAITCDNARICNNIIASDFAINGFIETSKISGNNVLGEFTFERMSECVVSDGYFAEFNTSSDIGGESGTVVRSSVISDNVIDSMTILPSADGGHTGTVFSQTSITGNFFRNQFFVHDETKSLGEENFAFDKCIVSNNICQGNWTIGIVTGDDNSIPFIKDSVFSHNTTAGTFNILGQIQDSVVSGNVTGGTTNFGTLRDTKISDGYYGGDTFIASVITSGTAMAESMFSDNIVSGDFTLGLHYTVGSIIQRSLVNDNIFSGSVSLCPAFTGSTPGVVMEKSSFSGNQISGTVDFADSGRTASVATYTDMIFYNNIIDDLTTISGAIEFSVIGQNIFNRASGGALSLGTRRDTQIIANVGNIAYGTTINGPSNAIALQSNASGSGIAVYGLGENGYGVVAGSDTTSPTRSSLHIVPQDSAPATAFQGDVYVSSNTGKFNIHNGSEWDTLIPKTFVANYGEIVTSPGDTSFVSFASNYTVPANTLFDGSIISGLLVISATDVTDLGRFDIKIVVGGTGLIFTTQSDTWWTPGANDNASIYFTFRVTADGASGSAIGTAHGINNTAAGVPFVGFVEDASFDTTVSNNVIAQVSFSAGGANNEATLVHFELNIY